MECDRDRLPKKKVVIVGNSSVGKTCIINTAKYKKFNPNSRETIGCDTTKIEISVDGYVCTLSIHDTAGQDAYQAMAPAYARKSLACLLVYSVTDRDSFESVEDWKAMLDCSDIPFYYLVGNKTDLDEEREVSTSEAIELAERLDCKLFEVSAKSTSGIEELFVEVASDLHENEKKIVMSLRKEEEHVVQLYDSNNSASRKRKCCK